MIKILFTISAILLLPQPTAAQDTSQNISNIMERTISGFIRPGYMSFNAAAKELAGDVTKLCEMPSEKTLASAQETFSKTALAWAGIELIRFGPVAQSNRHERILFYPDRRGRGLKQVQAILAKKDDSATIVERLRDKSVAVQGLGALEFLLFGTGHKMLGSGDVFRCDYASAITLNLVEIADKLISDWSVDSEATNIWAKPSADNLVLRSEKEALNALLGTLVHGLETVRDLRLGAFLRSEASKDRPKVAIFRRSGNTMPMIATNFQAVRNLLLQSGVGDLLNREDRAIVRNIVFELNNAERVSRKLRVPLSDSLSDPIERERLRYLKTSLTFSINFLDQDFAQAAGLSSGFSISDGD